MADILKTKIDNFSAISPKKYIKIFAHIIEDLLFANRDMEVFTINSWGILKSFFLPLEMKLIVKGQVCGEAGRRNQKQIKLGSATVSFIG